MPGSTTSIYWIVYVLQSLKDGNCYVGITKDLNRRYSEHQNGEVFSTKGRRPWSVIYFEGCLSSEDARQREKYLKTTGGRRFLAKRLKSHKTNSR